MKVTYKTPSGTLLLMIEPVGGKVGRMLRCPHYAKWQRIKSQRRIFGLCFTRTTGQDFVLEIGDAVPAYSKPCPHCAGRGYVYPDGGHVSTCPSCKGWGIAR